MTDVDQLKNYKSYPASVFVKNAVVFTVKRFICPLGGAVESLFQKHIKTRQPEATKQVASAFPRTNFIHFLLEL